MATSTFGAIVIGGGIDGLAAAVALAKAGTTVVLIEPAPALGGIHRDLEVGPGFRVPGLANDLGWVPKELSRWLGLDLDALGPADAGAGLAIAMDGGQLVEIDRDPGATAASLRRFSPRDAERWSDFNAWVSRLAGVLEVLSLSPAPRIDASGIRDITALLGAGRRLRGLGKREMVDLLRVVPMAVADLLDEWFEHDGLKAGLATRALADLCQGPRSGGTSFNLLHNRMGGGAFGRRVVRGGPAAMITALADRARANGVEIRTGTGVAAIQMQGERVAGVRLDSGEVVAAPEVVSSLDPARTLLELTDPRYLDPDFIAAVRNIRFKGARAAVLLGLERLPELPGSGDGRVLMGSFVVAPGIDYIERAYDATKYGEISADPWLDIRVPSLTETGLAPGDQHVMIINVQYAPYRLRRGNWDAEREALGDRVVALASRYLPGLAERIRHRRVLTPLDIERELGLTEGAVNQGEMMLDQILFMRPVAGWSRYATPIPGLFMTGPGTHPGPGVTGVSGWLAARAVLADRTAGSSRARTGSLTP